MAQDILQRFLTARLFDVSGEDARVEKLREAASDLVKVIQLAPQRAASFTMVAIDGDVAPDEPILAEVISILEKRWNSYAGAFADNVLRVVGRAIILDALGQLLKVDEVALAVALTARNFLPHLGSSADRALWAEMLAEADQLLEQRARRDWAMPVSLAATGVEFTAPEFPRFNGVTVKREWLQPKFEAAVGPQNVAGETLKNANPVWTNSPPQWSNEFAPRATAAVADALDAVAKNITDYLNEQATSKAFAEAVVSYVSQVASNLSQTGVGLERRSSLLWWKEALFSPGANLSYREMNETIAAVWAAIDALDLTGPFAPRMTEAFLKETVRSISPKMQEQVTLMDAMKSILDANDTVAVVLRSRLSALTLEPGRTTFASMLGHGVEAGSSEIRLGLPVDFEITPTGLALWLYRDLQIGVATKATKPSRGKGKVA
ncbi:hypothetical protein HFO55_32030 [Rhizobium leguminosarum]|uniref:GTPase-associated system all-helical protein GASH n=1 Tax=Rhizobium leguminosarum TaxID=384 RepID=UPI001C96442C|nr:GTPase-associated system all-helical protein GASH [Rhizobium leguminosarum]MBY5571773.1 hypothetical protein [Rhizobium leguminosarum]MBY5578310.1 hypothetical protein [Rhizobium leguminosarum]